ncbi:MAG: glycosyltransferase [Actinobacteria bacterium]|nr:glycosyltransferase [Actinomycetota bacterium]
MPRVSCVVVSFHRPKLLLPLLEHLRDERIEIVVVNVGRDPAVRDVCRGLTLVVDVHGNPGYAAAVNAGVAVVSGDVTVFMNDDLSVDAHSVLALAEAVRSGESDVAAPRLLTAEGATEPTIAALPTPISLAREWLALPDHPVGPIRRWRRVQKWRAPTRPEPVDAVAATVIAARTELLKREPLPEAYFLYWEESEWFWRLRADGVVTTYHPEVTVTHLGGRDDVRPEKSRLMARNAVRCVRRTQGRWRAGLAWPVVVAWQLRLVATALVRARRPLIMARLAGLWAGLGAWRELV